ncbi:hypothetical protein [Sphingomicrobium astaxanthinifaciens]|uniref:hypothetical protein n=1 Tax=Sphingomicrobium astaxanthinifaciens TaxID=1227949 RepID=UPI001FCB02ED|nr:hypothetical protein [Sphingomicrobium astaxanthinifaciens]MCJ7420833.1 hypothetical protein [Sphingomicrobium astaxanthinifaciens]
MARHERDFDDATPITLETIEAGLPGFEARIRRNLDRVRFLSGEKVEGKLSGAFADIARLTHGKDS